MNPIIRSFAPVAHQQARLLILGSMPGKASLATGQYYAHPRNLFWSIMQQLFAIDPVAQYPDRLEALKSCGIALWDVLGECERRSSLDGDIIETSIVPNDLPGFLRQYAQIRHIAFNGGKAEQVFKRYVLPRLTLAGEMNFLRLPSTSPANASIALEHKLTSWRQVTNLLTEPACF